MMKKTISMMFVLSLMLASFTAGVEYQRGDVDHDGQVDVADVACLIDYLLKGTWPDEPVTPPDNHEWVDLGLPSGTLWATCNVGANSPEEYGDYFAWGETSPKEVYNWSTYKWCNGSFYTLTKYCTSSNFGIVDGKRELDPEDDAAYVNWGPSWCMPTEEQQKELYDQCTWYPKTKNGVTGYMITGPNGKSLFLPAAGYRSDESLLNSGSYCSCWSRSCYTSNYVSTYAFEACDMGFNTNGYFLNGAYGDRSYGHSVRAVRVSQN